MPWSGTGTWSPVYNWTVEANNGVKILASHQDTQWGDLATSLGNVLCLDGQSKPTADINWNGHKITNLAAPSGAADAARLQDITANLGEWISETRTIAFVSGSQFKITGVDATSTYTIGRRLKIIHNGGATTSYVTVTASSFAVDTTITINGATLVSAITAISYSILNGTNLSIPRFGAVGVSSTGTINTASATTYLIGGSTPFPQSAVAGDIYGEFTGGGNYIPKYDGLYLVTANCTFIKNGATINADATLTVGNNTTSALGSVSSSTFSAFGVNALALSCSALVSATAGQALAANATSPGFTGGPVQSFGAYVSFLRVR